MADIIRPTRYELDYTLDPAGTDFQLVERVWFTTTKELSQLVWHALGLTVSKATLHLGQQKHLLAAQFEASDQTVGFALDKPLPAGNYQIDFAISGTYQDSLHGLYRSHFDNNGQPDSLLVTQFEATSAREALVCIDEPAAKAVFQVTITAPTALTALSNTPVKDQKTLGNLIQTQFSDTPLMSTYLLAFIVGDLEYTEHINEAGTVIRVYAVPGKQGQTAFALDVAGQTLPFFSDFFGTPYPLPKLDLVAVPDFEAGAMENWGLVTFRERALLVDPTESSEATRQYAAQVVVHELGHQWFGNLVTMQWWTDLWLNEGFASWTEPFALDYLFPDWDVWEDFLFDAFSTARHLDSLKSTHPIEVKVYDPAEISEAFDAISYAKGAVVIRMLYGYVGREAFQASMRAYLAKYAYRNAKTADLWAVFEATTGKPISNLMRIWTGQAGFPAVAYEFAGTTVTLSQQRFSFETDKSAATWPIPLELSDGSTNREILFAGPAATVDLEFTPRLINPSLSSFIVLMPTAKQLQTVLAGLSELPVATRFGLVSDALYAAKAGTITTGQLLETLAAFQAETNPTVWQMLLSAMSELLIMAAGHPEATVINQLIRKTVAAWTRQLGWLEQATDSANLKMLRPRLLGLADLVGVSGIAADAIVAMSDENALAAVPPTLREITYVIAARHGDEALYRRLLAAHQTTTFQEEQQRLSRALSSFRDPKLIQQTLNYSLSKQVRPQDAIMWWRALFANPAAKAMSWAYITEHWREIYQRYGAGSHLLGFIIAAYAEVANTQVELDDLTSFFTTASRTGIEQSLAQAHERIGIRVRWYDRLQAEQLS